MEWLKFNIDIQHYTDQEKTYIKQILKRLNISNNDNGELDNYENLSKVIFEYILDNYPPMGHHINFMPGLTKFLLNVCPDKTYKQFIQLIIKYEMIGVIFGYVKFITFILIPANVKSLEAFTFYNSSLEVVAFENDSKLKSIEAAVFEECESLKRIDIPASLKFLSQQVFSKCDKLKQINYLGTREQWIAIDKHKAWAVDSPIAEIKCIDGIIPRDGL